MWLENVLSAKTDAWRLIEGLIFVGDDHLLARAASSERVLKQEQKPRALFARSLRLSPEEPDPLLKPAAEGASQRPDEHHRDVPARQAVRPLRGGPRRRFQRRSGRAAGGDRAERRRQDDVLQPARRHDRADVGDDQLQGTRRQPHQRDAARARRDRQSVPDREHLSRSDGAAELPARRAGAHARSVRAADLPPLDCGSTDVDARRRARDGPARARRRRRHARRRPLARRQEAARHRDRARDAAADPAARRAGRRHVEGRSAQDRRRSFAGSRPR